MKSLEEFPGPASTVPSSPGEASRELTDAQAIRLIRRIAATEYPGLFRLVSSPLSDGATSRQDETPAKPRETK